MVRLLAAWPSKNKRQMNMETELRDQVHGWLTEWFIARGKLTESIGETTPENLGDTDYFEAGWLTSMEVVEFVMEIEQHFGMQFSESDLQDPRFVTIAGLAELILARSTQASQSR
ncbi:MAG: acyl carrier protein [Candidatus Sulfotelmatobacter sp.]